jgi:hypothetical protein
MENEIRLDSELNEEEVVRISATSKVKIEEKEESYMRYRGYRGRHTAGGGEGGRCC